MASPGRVILPRLIVGTLAGAGGCGAPRGGLVTTMVASL
jgi:hypothetical protein